jgi:hypothetical protein
MKHEDIIKIELAQIGFALAMLLKLAADTVPHLMMSSRCQYSNEAGTIIGQLNRVMNEIGKETSDSDTNESEVEDA